MRYLYKITNLINGKCYIGQTNNFAKRMREHKREPTLKTAIHLAIIKYGESNFSYEIIGTYDSSSIDQAEIDAIIQYKSLFPNGYNLDSGGNLFKKHHEETKKKISIKNKGKKDPPFTDEHRKRISEGNKGKKLSEEHKQKLRAIHTGKKVSEETRNKISQKLKGRKLSQETINKMIGRKASPETKAKMSKARMGRKLTESQIKALSERNKGKIVSQETRDKISKTLTGRPSPKKGTKMSEEQRKKLSIAHMGIRQTEQSIKKRLETMRRKGLIK